MCRLLMQSVCLGTVKVIQLVAFVKVMSAQVFVLTSSLNFDTFGESDTIREIGSKHIKGQTFL